MTLFFAIVLGALQGLTEFFPVSSSGHLIVLEYLLPLTIDPKELLGFDVLLHAGTAFALLFVYRTTWVKLLNELPTIYRTKSSHTLKLIVATIPAAIVGVLFQDVIIQYFRAPAALTATFAITALLLILRSKPVVTSEAARISWKQVLVMAFTQAIAVLPGVSRSGSTMAMGMQAGLSKRAALDFSFQMAMPIILGAVAFTLLDAFRGEIFMPTWYICLAGFISSFFFSVVAVYALRSFINRYELAWFAVYLIPLAMVCSFLR
jgi:undecaprenyl-diphosphatase